MKKRLLAMLLVLMMVVSLLPTGALADNGPTVVGDGEYTAAGEVTFNIHLQQLYKLLLLNASEEDVPADITGVYLLLNNEYLLVV